jgi:lipoate-protein ligase A
MSDLVCFWHHAADPFFNMAFDDAMLEQVLICPNVMYIRLYTWNKGTITIGVNQRLERAVCLEQLGGTPVIRRSTGGRAVFHDISELTYSLALNTALFSPAGGDLSPSTVYLRLSEGLKLFLSELGISSQIVRRSHADMGEGVAGSVRSCFASTARYELVTGDMKIVASAQRKVKSGILQHGSIKVSGVASHPALPDIPSGDLKSPQSLDRSHLEALAPIFSRAFSAVLGVPASSLIEADNPFTGLAQRVAALEENPLLKRDLN